MLLQDRIAKQQAAREKRRVEVLTQFIAKEEAARSIRIARHDRMVRLLENQEEIRRQQRKLKYAELCERFNRNNHSFSMEDIAALNPCGVFDGVKLKVGDAWHNNGKINIKQAVALGCTFTEIKWVTYGLSVYNDEIHRRLNLWKVDKNYDRFERLIYYMTEEGI